jgi:large subunit ribosomal protein L47
MRAIRHVLTERFYLWEDAVKLAKNDPEVNLSGDGPAFTPKDYLEEEADAVKEGQAQAALAAAAAAESTATQPGATTTPDPTAIPEPKAQAEAPRL